MSDQNIGVRAQFLTPQFSRGLAAYMRGLTTAIAKTNQTTAAINNLGAQSAAVFAALQANARNTSNALRNVANAASAANRALAGGRRRKTQATQQPGGQGLNPTLAAATARANQQASTQINAAAAATRNLGQQARVTTVSVSSLNARTIALGTALGSIAAQGIIGLGRQFTQLGGQIIEIVSFFERLELSVAFFTARSFQAEDASLSFNEALAKGEAEAQGLLIWLQRLAVASPFTTRTVGILFRTAQAYGLTRKEAELLTPLLLDFGAAAGLDADILERLALAFGQVRSRGKLTGEEVRQLGNSGLPVRDILVKALGIANDEFDKLLESGALTSDVVIPHLIAALKNFEGAGARIAFGTIGGIISAMEELREISTAKFFTGFLDPLKDSLQELFKVLNQPEVLAFVTILGQELGVKFRDAIFGVVEVIRSYIVAWQQLDPVVKQQIVVFAAATAGVFALAAAFGLLTLAMGVIANPLVLIATTIGFLVSEWTSGFTVLRGITSRTATSIGNTLSGIIRAFGAFLNGFGDMVEGITSGLNDIESNIANFGFNIGASLAEGIAASGNVIAGAMRGIGQILSFFLAPGSPPRIAPKIDVWGEKTMEEWARGVSEADVTRPFGPIERKITRQLQDYGPAFREAGGKSMLEYGEGMVDADFIGPLKKGGLRAVSVLADDEILGVAASAGIQASEEYVNGFLSRIPELTPKMSEELQKVLSKIGSGQQLSRQGAMSFGRFLEGFNEADFGVLDTVSGVVQEFFQSLVDTGEIEDVDLPRMIFGAREQFAQGIKDIEKVGRVTERTMQGIRATAGGASGFIIKLLNAYAPLRDATERVEEAQTTLNAITEKYKNILTPLRKELEAINEANKVADDQEKILSLQRLIANAGVSDRRRSKAQLEINQIIAEQRVRGLEKQRDAEVEAGEEELSQREKVQEQLEKQFSTLQANIQAQLEQLGLFGQEASIVKRLREEAEKLQEKEMTQAELQTKFLELQNAEFQDLIKAAKAKYDLTRADSTELEKQQAQLALAEVALSRRNREAEAIKLGIPVEELTKLRDLEVTLEDIGVKVKEAFDAPSLEGFGESLVDADAITKEWEATLAKVRDRWTEIKTQITETATEINNNLPSFLKIFPETPGGEPPIIGFIKNYTGVIVGLAIAMTTYNIVAKIATLVGAIRSLMTIGAIGTAGSAVGGAAAAGGGSAAIAAITTSVIALGVAAAATAVSVLLLKEALKGFGAGEEKQFKRNTEIIDETLGDFGPGLETKISDLAADITLNAEGANALAENITSAATTAIQDGFGDEHVAASIGNAINRSIVEGIIADTPANRQAISDFQAGLLTLLETAPTGTAPKVNIFTGAELSGEPTPVQAEAVKTDVQDFLAGITDDETKGAFAENMKSLIVDATNLGMDKADIATLVFGAFSAGVTEGLVADTPENRKAIDGYIRTILNHMGEAAEIDSPSKLTKREIGLPMGAGVISGIRAALVLSGPLLLTQVTNFVSDMGDIFDAGQVRITETAELIRDNVHLKFQNIKTLLTFRMAEINADQLTAWGDIRTNTETDVDAMELSVVTSFTTMRTDSEAQVLLLKASMVKLFGAGEEGILTAIKGVFLGKDNIVPRTMGKNFIQSIALGITENKETLSNAFTTAMVFALGETRDFINSGGAVNARTGGTVTTPNAATTTNNNRTTHYHLNVNSRQNSQGILSDYGIMQTLEGG